MQQTLQQGFIFTQQILQLNVIPFGVETVHFIQITLTCPRFMQFLLTDTRELTFSDWETDGLIETDKKYIVNAHVRVSLATHVHELFACVLSVCLHQSSSPVCILTMKGHHRRVLELGTSEAPRTCLEGVKYWYFFNGFSTTFHQI